MEIPENIYELAEWAESGSLSRFEWLTPEGIAHLCFPLRKKEFTSEQNQSLRRKNARLHGRLLEALISAADNGEIKHEEICSEVEDTTSRPPVLAWSPRFRGNHIAHDSDIGNRKRVTTKRHIHRDNFPSFEGFREWMISKDMPPANYVCLLSGWWIDQIKIGNNELVAIENTLQKKYGEISPTALPERILKILNILDKRGIPRLAIPVGTKESIQPETGLTPSVFDKTWEKASGAQLLRTEGYDDFTRKGSL